MSLPPQINMKGKNGEYETVVIEVRICRGPGGSLWSMHDVQSQEDAQIARKWPSGGVQQIAHALLLESIRREAFASSLVKEMNNPGFLAGWAKASRESKQTIEDEIVRSVREVMGKTTEKIGEGCVREVLEMLAGQLPLQK